MEITKQIYCRNRKDWREWLIKNHRSEKEIWLIYYKKHTKKPRVPYNDAVEEALCYGWIDSTVKRIDNERYCQRFTPRNRNSGWSELNKKRVANLIENNLMTDYGLEKVMAGKDNGKWYQVISSKNNFEIPEEFIIYLANSNKAKHNYESLSPSHKKQYIKWIASAKKTSTKIKRSKEAVKMLELNKSMKNK